MIQNWLAQNAAIYLLIGLVLLAYSANFEASALVSKQFLVVNEDISVVVSHLLL